MPPRGRKKTQLPAVIEPAPKHEVRGSIVKIKIGDRLIDVVKDRTCPVCMHPGRPYVEERILFNEGYSSIADFVSGVGYERVDGIVVEWPTITPQQIKSHYDRDHCPIDAKEMHRITGEANGKLEADYEQMRGRVVDSLAFTRLVVGRGQERIQRGEVKVSIKEALAAARLDQQVQQNAQLLNQVDRTAYYEQVFQIFLLTAEKIMSPEQWQEFSVAIRNSKDLQALIEKANQLPEAETA